MYALGDLVVYGIHGVCKIEAVEERRIDRKNVSYFVLSPIDQSGAHFYIPQHNQIALGKLKKLMTKHELLELLQSEKVRQDAWIKDEGQRKQYYKQLICSGDRVALLSMVHSLHIQRKLQADAGRKFHLCDENFLKDAEKLLSSEFAVVLNIPSNSVIEYLRVNFDI